MAITPIDPNAEADKQEQAANLQKSLNPIPCTEEELATWRREIEAARKRVKAHETQWDALMKEYLPIVTPSGTVEDVKSNTHFANVHTKLGSLFVKSPKVFLEPEGPALDAILDPRTGVPISPEDAIAAKQAILNKRLGRDGVNASRLMDECILDILIWAGLSFVKVGYRAVMKTIDKPDLVPNPAVPAQPGQPPALMPDPSGATTPTPIAIHEDWYAEKIDAKKGLFNADLKSPRINEKATWIGHDFYMKKSQAIREFGLLDDSLGPAEDDRIYKYDDDAQGGEKPIEDKVRGTELFYKASIFTDEVHPEAINHLVLMDGVTDRTVVHRPSPDQTFDAEGKLTDDSLIGFPIKVGTIRDAPDSPFPPSDCAFLQNLVKQEDTYVRQSVALRDAQIGKMLIDVDIIDDEADEDKLKNGPVGETIIVKSGALAGGADKVMASTPRVTGTVDDARGFALIKQEQQATLGLGGNQLGTPEATVRSATETASVATAVAGRNNKEQGRLIDFFLLIVRAMDTLIVRYTSGTQYVSVVGEDGARRLLLWNKKIAAGKYAYDIQPDSQLLIDVARDRQQNMALYNLTAKDPLANRSLILRKLARDFGYDPAKFVLQPVQQMTQPLHGGTADTANKHQADQTGQRPNAPGAAAANDNRQGRAMQAPPPASAPVPQGGGIPGGPVRPQ